MWHRGMGAGGGGGGVAEDVDWDVLFERYTRYRQRQTWYTSKRTGPKRALSQLFRCSRWQSNARDGAAAADDEADCDAPRRNAGRVGETPLYAGCGLRRRCCGHQTGHCDVDVMREVRRHVLERPKKGVAILNQLLP